MPKSKAIKKPDLRQVPKQSKLGQTTKINQNKPSQTKRKATKSKSGARPSKLVDETDLDLNIDLLASRSDIESAVSLIHDQTMTEHDSPPEHREDVSCRYENSSLNPQMALTHPIMAVLENNNSLEFINETAKFEEEKKSVCIDDTHMVDKGER